MRIRRANPLLIHSDDWRAVLTLEIYRILVAFGLIAIVSVGNASAVFDPVLPGAFRLICLLYLVQCVLATSAALIRRPPLRTHVLLAVVIDTAALVALAYCSAGVAGGLGMLLIAPLAAAGMLLPAQLANLVAACGAIGMLGQELVRAIEFTDTHAEFVQAGILGGLYFIAVGIAHWLARRARVSEARAEDQATRVRDLAELNHRIIERMQIGAIVVEHDGHVPTINEAALELLDHDNLQLETPFQLRELSVPLADTLAYWLDRGKLDTDVVRSEGRALLPSFSRLGNESKAPVLIFIEDARRQSEQAQQIKLISLGRLTASIAHEIRNPLGAISHAGQLLAESSELGNHDARLLDIVHRHTRRIDNIITSVLGLSRRAEHARETLDLGPWLDETIADYLQTHDAPPAFHLDRIPERVRVEFDSGHLRQVLFNLWDNATRYARLPDRALRVMLRCPPHRSGAVVLDIVDNGPGVAQASLEDILEPFFTTARDGTGLGLYIARELCEANGGQLLPVKVPAGACFRIIFATARLPVQENAGQAGAMK